MPFGTFIVVGVPYEGMPLPNTARLVEGAEAGSNPDTGRVVCEFGVASVQDTPAEAARLAADEKRGTPFAVDYFCPVLLRWKRVMSVLYPPDTVVTDGFVERPAGSSAETAEAMLRAERARFEKDREEAEAKARRKQRAGERADAKRMSRGRDTTFDDTVGR